MTPLLARIQADLTAARKAQDKPKVLLLGTIIADIKNREIELKRDVTDDDVTEVLRRGIKRRRESIEMYDKGGRADLGRRDERRRGDGEGDVAVQGTRGRQHDQRDRARGARGQSAWPCLRAWQTSNREHW